MIVIIASSSPELIAKCTRIVMLPDDRIELETVRKQPIAGAMRPTRDFKPSFAADDVERSSPRSSARAVAEYLDGPTPLDAAGEHQRRTTHMQGKGADRMSRIMIRTALAILAAGALGIATSSAASAAECEASVAGSWCLAVLEGGKFELTNEASFLLKNETGSIGRFIIVNTLEVECNKAEIPEATPGKFFTGEGPQIKEWKVKFTECKVAGQAGVCTVTEPIVTTASNGALGLDAENLAIITFKAPTETEFARFSIGGALCPSAGGPYVFTGEQICLAELIEIEGITDKWECFQSGSKLNVGLKMAKFEMFAEVKLTSERQWKFLKGFR